MNARLINYWDSFRGSFWFRPVLMAAIAIALALVTGWIDELTASRISELAPWAETTPSAAREALSLIASAMITLADVIFSITVVTVSMASSQYGSRLLRSFMERSLADFVMGAFVGSALFCLVTLRSVRDGSEVTDSFTPHFSTAFAMFLGLLSVGLLILFIHHVAISVQAPRIVQSIAEDLDDAIERLYPDPIDGDEDTSESVSARRVSDVGKTADVPDKDKQVTITPASQGYIEGIDYDTLATAASGVKGVMYLKTVAGQFVVKTDPVAVLECQDTLSEDERCAVTQRAQGAFVIGAFGTPRQDISCAVYELVDVAVRALSPGINDPMTAMNCIDRLGASLARMVARSMPNRNQYDDEGNVLVVAVPVPCAAVIHDGFRQIRQYGAKRTEVAIRLVEALTTIARNASRQCDRVAISEEGHAVRRTFFHAGPEPIDQRDFRRRFDDFREVLGDDADAGDPEQAAEEHCSEGRKQ